MGSGVLHWSDETLSGPRCSPRRNPPDRRREPGSDPRVFGSVAHQDDTEVSELGLSIDAAEGMTLFDKAAIDADIERLTHAKVEMKTPEDLSMEFRGKIIAKATPV